MDSASLVDWPVEIDPVKSPQHLIIFRFLPCSTKRVLNQSRRTCGVVTVEDFDGASLATLVFNDQEFLKWAVNLLDHSDQYGQCRV